MKNGIKLIFSFAIILFLLGVYLFFYKYPSLKYEDYALAFSAILLSLAAFLISGYFTGLGKTLDFDSVQKGIEMIVLRHVPVNDKMTHTLISKPKSKKMLYVYSPKVKIQNLNEGDHFVILKNGEVKKI